VEMRKMTIWKGVYQVWMGDGSERKKSRDCLTYYRKRADARACAEQSAGQERSGRVVPNSVKTERHAVVVIGQENFRYYFAFPMFKEKPGVVDDARRRHSCKLVVVHGSGRRYFKTETRSFSPAHMWDGKGKRPLDCLVLVGDVYYTLGQEVHPHKQ